ncbi:MAG: cobalamin-dependent protein [Desulfobacteraceae bacterium]
MILFVEPISRNIGMYVPAYPLPLMEIASFVKSNMPQVEVGVISMPVDYGLPLTQEGKDQVYRDFLKDLAQLKPISVGISCTAIAQAEEVIHLSELIKEYDPDIFVFVGGYFPSIYYEEILSRTSTVDAVVIGEGEIPAVRIIEFLVKGKDPLNEKIANLSWKQNGHIQASKKGVRFDLARKVPLDLELLRYPRAYDILPYAFSRGCAFKCNYCMEDSIRPARREVPHQIIRKDLTSLSQQSSAQTLLISDALFKSFDLFPFIRSLDMKVNFETRSDVLDPSVLTQISDICGALALGFESASYNTLRRMNKVKDKNHYERYISNTVRIFDEAVKSEIPLMVFMIAGYPGDSEADLEESLRFAEKLSERGGEGGYIFKIGECHAYPKTKVHDQARALPNIVFDNDGVFGQNIVRQPSKHLDFETILDYTREIFNLSNYTPKFQAKLLDMMPFFRLPSHALQDDTISDICFMGVERTVLNVRGESLSALRGLIPSLTLKYKEWMSSQRSMRSLPL